MSSTVDYITQAKTNIHVKKLEQFLASDTIKSEKGSPYTNMSDQGRGRIYCIPFKQTDNDGVTLPTAWDEPDTLKDSFLKYRTRDTETKMDEFFRLYNDAWCSGAHMNYSEMQFFTIPGKKPTADYVTLNKTKSPISSDTSDGSESEETPVNDWNCDAYDSEEVSADGHIGSESEIGEYGSGDENSHASADEFEEQQLPSYACSADIEVERSGIMLDFDIFQPNEPRQITEAHYYQLAYQATQVFGSILTPVGNSNNGELLEIWCIFTRKPRVEAVHHKDYGDCYKDGFHMLVPGIKISKSVKKYIIHHLHQTKIIEDVFRDCEILNPLENVLDKGSVSVPVLLHGSCKRNKIPYEFDKLFNVSLRCTTGLPLVRPRIDFDELPDPKGAYKTVTNPSDRRKKIQVKRTPKYKYNIPYELSLHFEAPNGLIQKYEYDAIPELEAEIEAFCERRAGGLISEAELEETASNVADLTVRNAEAKYLKDILEILSPHRVREFHNWRAVVLVLATQSQEYKTLAEWFSQRFPQGYINNAQGHINNLFEWAKTHSLQDDEEATKRVRGLGTLYEWAKTDNPQKYAELQDDNAFMVLVKLVLKNDGNLNDAHIAKVLWTMFRMKFKFAINRLTSSKDKFGQWMEFVLPTDRGASSTEHVYKWRHAPYPYTLDSYISDKLPEYIRRVRDWLQEQRDDEDADEGTQKYYEIVHKNVKRVEQGLGNAARSRAIIRKCENDFIDYDFFDRLDTNRTVIGVGNGVLRVHPVTQLINQYHDIPIARYTDVEYLPYDPGNPFIRELEGAIRDLFANDQDAHDYTMMYLASTLDGKTKIPILYIWLGEGSNGKSFLLELHINTLRLVPAGGYGAKLPVEFLTTQRPAANASNPAMMVLKHARFVYFSESEQGDTLRMGNIKEITSETLSARNHNESQDNFRANCHFVFCSNHDPRVQGSDHGTWRRILVYRFKVKFCMNPDPDNIFEKKVNSKYIDEVPNDHNYKRAYLSILMKWYETYRNVYHSKLNHVPKPTIDKETLDFRNEQDKLNKFITTQVVHVGPGTEKNPTPKIRLEEVVRAYIKWYQATVEHATLPQQEVMKAFKASALKKYLDESYGRTTLKEHVIVRLDQTGNPEEISDSEDSDSEAGSEEEGSEEDSAEVVTEEEPSEIENESDLVEESYEGSEAGDESSGEARDESSSEASDEFENSEADSPSEHDNILIEDDIIEEDVVSDAELDSEE